MIAKLDKLRIDGYSLSVFVSVCETGSVSRTAELFDVSQSSISHIIEKLRNALGDPLFVKAGRGITPTDRAMQILPRAKDIVADIEGLADEDDYDFSHDGRPVVIAIPTPAIGDDLKVLHRRLCEHAPNVRLEIRRLAPRSQLEEMLSSGEAELAISVNDGRYPTVLNHCRYDEEDLVVYYDASMREPVRTIEEYAAARHGVVHFGGNVRSEVEKKLRELRLSRNVSIVAPTASMLGELIRGTDVIATMPARLATGPYRGLSHMPPPIQLGKISYDLVWHRRHEHSSRNQWLRWVVLNAAQRSSRSLSRASAARSALV